jgi:hypothetical protein
MNAQKSSKRHAVLIAALATVITALQFTSHAYANDAALLKCRTLTENTARLACYDAISASPDAASSTSGSEKPVSAATTTNAVDGFGLEAQTPSAQLKRVESRIKGLFMAGKVMHGSRLKTAKCGK